MLTNILEKEEKVGGIYKPGNSRRPREQNWLDQKFIKKRERKKMQETLKLLQQDLSNKKWYTIGELKNIQDLYSFCYFSSIKRFISFDGMKDTSKVYYSEELFPLFRNRLISPKRPEYPRFVNWLGGEQSVLSILGLAGSRATDSLEMFTIKEEGRDFYVDFFLDKTKKVPNYLVEYIEKLKKTAKNYKLRVRKISKDAPVKYKVRCRLEGSYV